MRRAFVFVILLGVSGFATGQLLGDMTQAAEQFGWDNVSVYDTGTPNVPSNKDERICVRDFTDDASFSASYWNSTLPVWLSVSNQWESVGTTKINIVEAVNCSNPTLYIDFYDLYDSTFINNCGAGNAACAPFPSGTLITNVTFHTHRTASTIMVATPQWTCNNLPPGSGCAGATDYGKIRLINHEMGHSFGLNHDGPVMGVVGDGNVYYSNWEWRPEFNEVYQLRAHANRQPSPALNACIGYPASNQVMIAYFDTAVDDTNNQGSFWRYENGWVWKGDFGTFGGVGGTGSVYSKTITRSDAAGALWTVRADVRGGNDNVYNGNPVMWTEQASLSPTVPNRPCTLKVTHSGNGNISINWKDASYSENNFLLCYNRTYGNYGNGYINPNDWQCNATCPANVNGCGDTPAGGRYAAGEYICMKIRATNGWGSSGDSNTSCTRTW